MGTRQRWLQLVESNRWLFEQLARDTEKLEKLEAKQPILLARYMTEITFIYM